MESRPNAKRKFTHSASCPDRAFVVGEGIVKSDLIRFQPHTLAPVVRRLHLLRQFDQLLDDFLAADRPVVVGVHRRLHRMELMIARQQPVEAEQ